MSDDIDTKRALIERLATGPRSEREISGMVAKWSVADLEAMVELICPRPTPQEFVRDNPVSDEAADLMDEMIAQGRRDGAAPWGI